jgi:hypothetical protein
MWFSLRLLDEKKGRGRRPKADAHVWVGGENSTGKPPNSAISVWPKPVLDGLYRCLIQDPQHHGFNFFGHTPELRGMKHFDRRRGPDSD